MGYVSLPEGIEKIGQNLKKKIIPSCNQLLVFLGWLPIPFPLPKNRRNRPSSQVVVLSMVPIELEHWPVMTKYPCLRRFRTMELHPRKLTWQWKITILNRKYNFKWLFFYCHMSFRGCTQNDWKMVEKTGWSVGEIYTCANDYCGKVFISTATPLKNHQKPLCLWVDVKLPVSFCWRSSLRWKPSKEWLHRASPGVIHAVLSREGVPIVQQNPKWKTPGVFMAI